MPSAIALAAATGAALAGGVVALVAGCRPQVADLSHALERLDGGPAMTTPGWWRWTHGSRWSADLSLEGTTPQDFFRRKLTAALLGGIAPAALGTVCCIVVGWSPLLPGAVAVLGAALGFFLPDLRLRSSRVERRADATEALLAYFDLVTLERLGNVSASQSLASAAGMSDSPLFCRVRDVVQRAQLEQRPPWSGLAGLADELELPALRDLADVMRLDDTGAALSGSLRARVRELRDAHLADTKMRAHAVSESMTLAMAVPTVVFALIFMTPPLLRLLS